MPQAKLARPGKFITVEGGEGVGKSSFVSGLAAALRPMLARHGIELVTTREPGGTPTANLIRGLFAQPAEGDPLFVETEFLLVSAARAQHVRRLLLPALERGAWVLCDRYADSSRIYQGVLGGHDQKDLEAIIHSSTAGLEPDATLLLDLDVPTAQARIAAACAKQRGDGVARYDDARASTHEKVRAGFLTLQKRFPQRIELIDAAPAANVVLDQGLATLRRRFHELA